MAAGLRDAGFRVTWVGPSGDGELGETGIEFRPFRPSLTRLGRPLSWLRAFWTARKIPGVDIVMGVAPDSLIVAIAVARLCGARVIFDLHEAYHEDIVREWAPAALLPAASRIILLAMRQVIAASDLVVASSPTLLAPYAGRIAETVIVRNCTPTWIVPRPVNADDSRCLTIMHGKAALGRSLVQRGTSTLLDALQIVRARGHAFRLIVFDNFQEDAGSYGDRLRDAFIDATKKLGLEDVVDLREMIPIAQMQGVLNEADIGVIAYNREYGIRSLPGRLFEYMAAGLPVIGPDYSSDISAIVQQEKCGVLVDCENAEAMADALCRLAENPSEMRMMGARGREAFEAHYRWEKEIEPLLDRICGWFNRA